MVGKVSEASIGGVSFVRVDVPGHGENKPYTRYLGNGAIYSMTPMNEDAAKEMLDYYGTRTAHSVLQLPERSNYKEPNGYTEDDEGESELDF